MIIDEVEFTVEQGKLQEFVRAVGGTWDGASVPLTFVVVAGHWRDQAAMLRTLGLDIRRVVVGGSEWEYLVPVVPGDRLRGARMLLGIEQKATMRLFTLETRFERVRDGVSLVVQRDTVIELGAR